MFTEEILNGKHFLNCDGETSLFQVSSTSFCIASKNVTKASRRGRPEMFCKKSVPENFVWDPKFLRKSILKKIWERMLLEDSEVFKTFSKDYGGNHTHCVKSVRVRSFFGPYFLVFELNTERYGVSLFIQFKCRKIWTRKTPNTGTSLEVIILRYWAAVTKIWSQIFRYQKYVMKV